VIGGVLALAVVAAVLLLDPDRDDPSGSSSPPGDGSPPLTAGREFCDAYLAVSRADDQLLADGTPQATAALADAVDALVLVAARTDLTGEERAGLVFVVDGIVAAAGLERPDLSAGTAVDDVPFAAASTAFSDYLTRTCSSQLGPTVEEDRITPEVFCASYAAMAAAYGPAIGAPGDTDLVDALVARSEEFLAVGRPPGMGALEDAGRDRFVSDLLAAVGVTGDSDPGAGAAEELDAFSRLLSRTCPGY
jgi:hypothetical protein